MHHASVRAEACRGAGDDDGGRSVNEAPAMSRTTPARADRRVILFILCLAVLIAQVDTSVVNLAVCSARTSHMSWPAAGDSMRVHAPKQIPLNPASSSLIHPR